MSLRDLAKKIPFVARAYRKFLGANSSPDTSYLSPIPNMGYVRDHSDRIYKKTISDSQGVELKVAEQLSLLEKFQTYYGEMSFPEQQQAGKRYYFENPWYSYGDAIFLYSMMRHYKPRRIIEIGSGFSSAVMLDVNDQWFDSQINMTFVEPYPQRLKSLLTSKDSQHQIQECFIQEVNLELFDSLQANDFLFVDSSHVLKLGSDLQTIFFEILPRLAVGVKVHFHDIFYPFEYSPQHAEKGKFWNELYVLRAFLQFNHAFEIVAWNNYLGQCQAERLQSTLPLCMKNIGGAIWLNRCA